MKNILFLLIFALGSVVLQAQLTDDFSDGDFTNNPTWSGNTDRFQINTSELQLNDVNYDSPVSSLSINAPTQGTTTWEFYVRMDFNPSSTNYTRVYLSSNASDFAGSLNGYFVLLGGTDDVVELRTQTGTSTSALISSPADVIDVAAPEVRVRVTRDASNTWELFADVAGGTSYTSYGTSTNADHPLGFFYGVRCNYTSTRRDKFFFDDFLVDPLFVDNTPPILQSADVNSSTEVVLHFDEPLDPASVANISNYSFDNGATVASAMLDPSDPTSVIITFSSPLTNLTTYTVTSTVSDSAGNAAANTSTMFTYAVGVAASPFDMMINELMADPSPVVGMPDAEFVEIYNRSSDVFDLADYELSSGSTPQQMPTYLLLPGEYVVVCDDSKIADFNNIGISNVVAVSSFNALTNGGDNITIADLSGQIIHSVDYDDSWYQDDVKDDGGWTLELINPENPCDVTANNWSASNNPLGGTPGQQNSIYDISSTSSAVQLLSSTVIAPVQVELTFSTAVDNVDATDVSNYMIDNGVGNPTFVSLTSPSTVALQFSPPLAGNILYTVTVNNINDCTGNNGVDPTANSTSFQLPEPSVLSAIAAFPSGIVTVTFDMAMDATSVQTLGNYNVPGIGSPTSINVTGPFTVELTFGTPFNNGSSYDLEIENTANVDGTIIEPNPTIIPFVFYEPVLVERYDIIINEFMPDPADRVGLPELEFIELYNRSNKIISLENFTLVSGTSTSSPLPFLVLQPGDYAVVAKEDTEWNYDAYNNSIALASMIALSNSGDDISLYSSAEDVIDALVYDLTWYKDGAKDDGGYTLERINPSAPCEGSDNWRASDDILGGTPGAANSVLDDQADVTMPTITSAFPNSPTILNVYFNESLDESIATDISLYSIDGGIDIIQVNPIEPLLNQVAIVIAPSTPLALSTVYELTINTALTDCVGNGFDAGTTIQFALPEEIEEGDVIINEVLSDPPVGGSDFIELYNNSDKIVNIADLIIVNDVASSSPNKPVETDFLLFPQSYVVLTPNPSHITENYSVQDETLLLTNSLPTLSADFGNVTIITEGGLIDRFDYEEEYHTALLDDPKGVSLERIDFDAFTNDRNNWHSAASSVGYATPTYENSQISSNTNQSTDVFTLADDTFSPDSDGYKDFLRLDYNTASNGDFINIKIYDAKGRLIKNLVENELLASEGFYQWDGTNDEGTKARIGIYIVWIETFGVNGNVNVEKKTCVLAGQL